MPGPAVVASWRVQGPEFPVLLAEFETEQEAAASAQPVAADSLTWQNYQPSRPRPWLLQNSEAAELPWLSPSDLLHEAAFGWLAVLTSQCRNKRPQPQAL
jgi:hypothetical protein